ncbi:hypothetical protein G5I_09177 [Acromyrmex echinatior]|uniref:Uncharacterized protein n=1 Tax=Acromyrmex echinatior TaxID=103372 RepID=F4WTH9_ACREC|nr:hypothetical protein G5I_09177 [Acromyrmex echinatior]
MALMPFLQTPHDQNYSDSRVATTVTLVIYPETNPRNPPSTAHADHFVLENGSGNSPQCRQERIEFPSSGNGKNLAESVNAAHWLGNSGYPLHGAERGPYCAIKSNQRRRCLAARRVSRPFVIPFSLGILRAKQAEQGGGNDIKIVTTQKASEPPKMNDNCCHGLAFMVLPSLPFFRIIVFFSLIRFHRPTAEGNNGRILLQDIEWNKRRTVIPYARISVKGEAILRLALTEYGLFFVYLSRATPTWSSSSRFANAANVWRKGNESASR